MGQDVGAKMTPVDYALGAFATARLARLVTRDSILDRPRLAYIRAMDRNGHHKLAELAVCPWCVSVWIGVALSVAGHRKVPGYRVATAALSFSMIAGLLNELGSEGDDD